MRTFRKPRAGSSRGLNQRGQLPPAKQAKHLGPALLKATREQPCPWYSCKVSANADCRTATGMPAPYHRNRVEAGRKVLKGG